MNFFTEKIGGGKLVQKVIDGQLYGKDVPIYCEAELQSEGWDENWLKGCENQTVLWDIQERYGNRSSIFFAAAESGRRQFIWIPTKTARWISAKRRYTMLLRRTEYFSLVDMCRKASCLQKLLSVRYLRKQE